MLTNRKNLLLIPAVLLVVLLARNGAAFGDDFEIPDSVSLPSPNSFVNDARDWLLPLLIAFCFGLAGVTAFKLLIYRS